MPKFEGSELQQRPSSSDAREAWLKEIVSAMRGWFDDLGFPLPDIDIRSGFPSAGRRSRKITESWVQDDGATYVIYVRPDRGDAFEVAAAVAHQLCQIATGNKDRYGHLFRHLAISIGLRGRKTESPPGVLFTELAGPIIERLGPLPCPEITPTKGESAARQSTRMVKVVCPTCGYVARVSRKWLLEVGPPHCPRHGAMEQSA